MPKLLYPRGYVVLSGVVRESDDYTKVPGDKEVQALFNEMQFNPNALDSWEFCAKVATYAHQRFLYFPDWLKAQINSPVLYGYNLGFIIDTLQFIIEGKRTVSIGNWLPIIFTDDDTLSSDKQYANQTRTQKKREGICLMIPSLPKHPDYLSQWIARENGLADLVYSLMILFGTNINKPDNW